MKKLIMLLSMSSTLAFSNMVKAQECVSESACPEYLVENTKGINLKLLDERKTTKLHKAIEKGDLEAVKRLIEGGADINKEQLEYGDTPLQSAVRNGHTEIVEFLIKAGALVNDGYNPLFMTTKPEIADLLIKAGAKVNAIHANGSTPLFIAAGDGHTEFVKFLIDQGADIHQIYYFNGQTPLHIASNVEIAKTLIEAGANVHKKDSLGNPPIFEAAARGHAEVVKFLVGEGANVNEKNMVGKTPFHKASSAEVAKILIEAGADFNEKDYDGDTPLHSAAEYGRVVVVNYLIGKGSNVNEKNKKGESPLHKVAGMWSGAYYFYATVEVAEQLIEVGSNVNEKSNFGETPLYLSALNGNFNLVKYLVEKGADINEPGILSVAKKEGHKEIAKFLKKHGAK